MISTRSSAWPAAPVLGRRYWRRRSRPAAGNEMSRSTKGGGAVAIGAGIAVVSVAARLFRLPGTEHPAPVPRAATLRLGPTAGNGLDPLFGEETALRDPT